VSARWRGQGRRPRRRAAFGCLLVLLGVIVLLIVLSVLFGGFRKGTKVGGGPGTAQVAAVSTLAARWEVHSVPGT
jgi:amino acid transporter